MTRIGLALDTATPFATALVAALSPAAIRIFLPSETVEFEWCILKGDFDGVIDAAVRELAREHLADRLTAAALAGVPQVIVPLDFHDCTPKQCDAAGHEIAQKASASRGPVRVVVARDTPAVLRQSLANWIYPSEVLLESNADEFDEGFAIEAARIIHAMLALKQS
jgi:hypothetical protein